MHVSFPGTDGLRATVAVAPSYWAAAVAMAGFWRAHAGPGATAREDRTRREAWALRVGEVEGFIDDDSDGASSHAECDRLVSLLDGCSLDDVHAICWGLCNATAETFAASWRRELDVQQLALIDGQPFPAARPRWPQWAGRMLTEEEAATPPDRGEFPGLRFHRAGRFEIVADFQHSAPLTQILSRLRSVATLHPNSDHATDFHFTVSGGSFFPLTLRRPQEQRGRVLDLLDQARDDADASLVVGPELTLDPEIVRAAEQQLQTWQRRALVVLGSHHVRGADDQQENLATAMISGRTRYPPLEHRKVTAIDNDLRAGASHYREALDIPEVPRLVVHHADAHRVAILICKDFLDDRVHQALTRASVNVVLVPAMSEKTDLFAMRAAQRVAASQSLSLVANGPEQWPVRSAGTPVRARHAAVVATPTAPTPLRTLRPQPAPALLHIDLVS